MKITIKILLSIVVMMIFALVATVIFSYWVNSENYTDNELKSNQILADQLMQTIDRILYERMVDVKNISFNMRWRDAIYLTADQEVSDFKKEIDQLIYESDAWSDISIVNADKQLVIFGKNKIVQQEEFEIIESALNGYETVSDVYRDESGRLVMSFSSPIRDHSMQGQPIVGVVIGEFAMEYLNDYLLRLKNDRIFLFDFLGNLLAGGDETFRPYLLKQKTNKNESLQSATFGEKIVSPSLYYFDKVFLVKSQQQGYRSFAGNDWQLVIEIPKEKIDQDIVSLIIKMTLLFIPVVIFIAVFFALTLYRIVLKPIFYITSMIKIINQGQYEERLLLQSNDEFKILAKSINKMLDQILLAKKQVEKKVKTRTAELEKVNDFLVGRELKIRQLKDKLKNENKK